MSSPNPSNPDAAHRPNTLGWGERDLSIIIDALESKGRDGQTNVKRDFSRWPFRKTTIPTRIWHPGGSLVTLKLACRNISRGGISLLHNAFVHPGTKVSVMLPLVGGGAKESVGKVKRCIHVRGPLHEIGLAFEQPIDLRQYLEVAKTPDFHSLERVDPASLQGRILYVDDADLDLRIVQHYFRETSAQIKVSSKPQEALAIAQEGVDLIITDWLMPEMSGTEFLGEVRRQRIDTPAIILTVDPMGLMQQGYAELSNVTLLAKPVQQIQLLRAVAEQMLLLREAKDKAGSVRDSAGGIDPKFVPVLEGYADKIAAEVDKDDFSTALALCSNLRTNATSLGASALADVAAAAANAITVHEDPTAVRRRLRETIATCKRVVALSKAA